MIFGNFLAMFWKIGCTKLQKNPKKWNNTLGFFFGFHSKLVREHNGPKKMDPPCMFLVGYFGTFNLNFDFLKKKYLGHPKMTKIFFFAPINTFHQHLEFFNYLEKQKSYSHQGNPDWQHFWVKREISGGRKALRGTKNQKSCFLFFICMGHKYNISNFQPNRWFCCPWGVPLHLKWPHTQYHTSYKLYLSDFI